MIGKPKEERHNLQIKFVNTKSKERNTALHLAAQAGADVNKRTDKKKNPLRLAAISGQANVVRYLVMHYANINAKDEDFMTPSHRSVQVKFLALSIPCYFHRVLINTVQW